MREREEKGKDRDRERWIERESLACARERREGEASGRERELLACVTRDTHEKERRREIKKGFL